MVDYNLIEELQLDSHAAEKMIRDAFGDTVNVASRLSQRARAGEALMSSEVRRSLGLEDEMPVLELPALQLRGRAAPVSIYCLPAGQRIDFREE